MSSRLNDMRVHASRSAEDSHDLREVEQRAATIDPFADPGDFLELPDLGPDATVRWAALHRSDGDPDHRTIDSYLRQGWRPVRPIELPAGYYVRTQNFDPLGLGDVVTRGELTLMVEHRAFTERRRKMKEDNVRSQLRSAAKMQGVGDELPKTSEDRGSEVKFGRRR